MIIKYVGGDLVQMIRHSLHGDLPPIMVAQGCNCHCRQGSGLAKSLREFPEVLRADLTTAHKSSRVKLGSHTMANLLNTCGETKANVFNLYTQESYGGPNVRWVSYAAIGKAFMKLNELYQNKKYTLYIPRIGAGLANGEWEIIAQIIDDATPELDIIVIDFEPGVDPRLCK